MADYNVAAIGERKVKEVQPPPLWTTNNVDANAKGGYVNSVFTAFGDRAVSSGSYQ